jgi:hypothetical protein
MTSTRRTAKTWTPSMGGYGGSVGGTKSNAPSGGGAGLLLAVGLATALMLKKRRR